ncbi:hypothetical protein GCM10010495_73680 [Kitasatospora herbaricolor]|nr:hypothetical protein GCM10010495_73680 [Kitasatospora herbaricolor]
MPATVPRKDDTTELTNPGARRYEPTSGQRDPVLALVHRRSWSTERAKGGPSSPESPAAPAAASTPHHAPGPHHRQAAHRVIIPNPTNTPQRNEQQSPHASPGRASIPGLGPATRADQQVPRSCQTPH